jgi:hypothetical protein
MAIVAAMRTAIVVMNKRQIFGSLRCEDSICPMLVQNRQTAKLMLLNAMNNLTASCAVERPIPKPADAARAIAQTFGLTA